MIHALIFAAHLMLSATNAAATATAPTQDSAVFEQELERVQVKMGQGKWKSARSQLERSLEVHENQPYVLENLGEIELILKRCTYWESSGQLDLASLFKGELLSYTPMSGKIKLRYEEGEPHDFVVRDLALVHEMEFSGPYSIEVEGTDSHSYMVCVTPRSWFQVAYQPTFYLGTGSSNRSKAIERKVLIKSQQRNEDGTLIIDEETKEFTTKPNTKSTTAKVSVSSRTVSAYYNGKKRLTMRKPQDLWGSLAIPLGGPHGTITIEGNAEAFIKKKRDEAFDKGWKTFERGWKLKEHLPDWLVTRLASAGASRAGPGAELKQLSQDQIGIWNEAVRALEDENHEEVLNKTTALLAQTPDVPEVYLLRAQAHLGLRQREAAIGDLAPCAARFPNHAETMSLLARLYLVSGRFNDVIELVGKAVSAGLPPEEFQAISITANKAIHGPIWSEKHTYESRHYLVSSDISRERCRQVALELEATYRHVSQRMGVGEHQEGSKFQAFAFSGQASYLNYIEDVFEGHGEFTQGMYSSYLKQLLVLDSEPRETFMKTVRHEGFHQFFDSVLDAPPIWLNEGLAEYFASARTKQGSWRDGRLNEVRLSHLRTVPNKGVALQARMTKLSSFLQISQQEFMRKGQDNYAQAWALVHFLRHSSARNKAIYQELLAGLLAGDSNMVAIEKAFEGVDLQEMDRELQAYVNKL
jgi:tetratricopeptide (TPR) repeat protein